MAIQDWTSILGYSASPLETMLVKFSEPDLLPVPNIEFDVPGPATLSVGTDLIFELQDLLYTWDAVKNQVKSKVFVEASV